MGGIMPIDYKAQDERIEWISTELKRFISTDYMTEFMALRDMIKIKDEIIEGIADVVLRSEFLNVANIYFNGKIDDMRIK